MKRLKDYTITTKIILKEHRQRYKKDGVYEQPFECYSVRIDYPHGELTCRGGFKNMKEVIKWLGEELR